MASRAMLLEVNGTSGVQKLLRQPLLMDGDGGSIRCQAPALGQHNDEVFGALAA